MNRSSTTTVNRNLQPKDYLIALVLAVATGTLCNRAAQAESSSMVLLAQSSPHVATSAQIQRFSDTIDLHKGQDKLRLILVYNNGTATEPSYKWLRVASSSMNFVTEQQFNGKKQLEVDVTGELARGGNQILVTAGGTPGAVFSWQLYTLQPTVSEVQPTTVEPGGTVTIVGQNLCPAPSANAVTINGAPARCISAAANSVVAEVPDDLQSGTAKVSLNTAGFALGALSCNVLAAPHLSRLSSGWAPAGSQLTIYGEGFGDDPTRVKVSIGPLQVAVDSSTKDQITVTIPGSYQTAWAGYYMPVKVAVNGVKASNQLTVSCADTAPTGAN